LCRHIGLAFADVTRRFADAPDTQHTLRKLLAAAIDLHAQVKQAHWNVRGPSFIAIHELFDKVSTEVENYSDLIAERAGGLGGTALARSKQRLSALFSSPIRLASRTSRNTYLPFRERRIRPIRTRGHRSSGNLRRCRYRRFVHRNLAGHRPSTMVHRIPLVPKK
jgi:ferritin-like protein